MLSKFRKAPIKRTLPFLALLSKSSPAFPATLGAVAGGLASVAGDDPWTWIIGGFGAAIVFVKKPTRSRADAIVNSLISVLIAGLVSPVVSIWIFKKFDLGTVNPYPAALILSAVWPWVLPAVSKKFHSLGAIRTEAADIEFEGKGNEKPSKKGTK